MSFWDEKRRFSLEMRQKTQSGGLDRGLVHQQDSKVIADWIQPIALAALEGFRVYFQHQRFLADWTDEDLQ